jgi:MFS family permease
MLVNLGLMGVGMGMTMLSLLLALQQAVPRERLGVATSIGQFTRSMGGAVGVALMGAIVAASLPPGGEHQPRIMEAALHRAFIAGAVIALIALVAGLRVPSGLPSRRPSERLDAQEANT